MYRNVKRVTYKGTCYLDAFNTFMLEKKANGRTGDTARNYEASFYKFLSDNNLSAYDTLEADKSLILRWVNGLIDKDVNGNTINHYIGNLRVFLYWCMNNGYISPFKISLIKTQEQQLKFFSDSEIQTLLRKPKADDSYTEHRTYAIICFILATGARAATVISIKKEDVDYVEKSIKYSHLKNKKAFTAPLSASLEKILKEYLRTWDIQSDYLFCEVTGAPMTVSALRQALVKYCNKRNVDAKGPHALRHSFARCWIKNGGNAFTLQKMLTHSDITMTKRYVRLFDEELKIDYEQYSPLDRIIKPYTTVKRL